MRRRYSSGAAVAPSLWPAPGISHSALGSPAAAKNRLAVGRGDGFVVEAVHHQQRRRRDLRDGPLRHDVPRVDARPALGQPHGDGCERERRQANEVCESSARPSSPRCGTTPRPPRHARRRCPPPARMAAAPPWEMPSRPIEGAPRLGLDLRWAIAARTSSRSVVAEGHELPAALAPGCGSRTAAP